MLLNRIIRFADLHKELFPIVLNFLIMLNTMVESFATDLNVGLSIVMADRLPVIGYVFICHLVVFLHLFPRI